MTYLELLKTKILNGHQISKSEAIKLIDEPLTELTKSADELRAFFCGNKFDICTIINAKSGRCSEDCKYCAQSIHYPTNIKTYNLIDTDAILKQAQYNYNKGVLRYAVVTSGKNLTDEEIDKLCYSLQKVKEKCPIKLCVSVGLLNEKQFKKLNNSGVERIHNNLETSRHYFPNICTTHTFMDKVQTIKMAQKANMNVCSGGIIGLGETMIDRIEMAFELRKLNVDSVPINILNPIKKTPYEHNKYIQAEEIERIVAIFRFILPKIFIRLAGGRGLLNDKGEKCLKSGANALISGDMLTTSGISIEQDMQMIKKLGFNCNL